MSIKKVPMRTCVACMVTRPKRELVRVVRTMDGTLVVDRRGKVSGRGAYLCADPDCVEKALATHKLERALKVPLTEDLIGTLKEIEGVQA